MPEISRFYGLIIKMFFNDHNPPHFHIEYGEHRAIMDIREAELLEGYLPNKALKLAQAWCVLHEEELLANFEGLRGEIKSFNTIEPLN